MVGTAEPSFATPDADALFQRLERWVRGKPHELAVSFLKDLKLQSTDFTWSELYQLMQRGASAYRQAGLQKGDRVLIELPTSEIFASCILGAFYLGLVPAVIAPREGRTSATAELEWSYQLDLFRAKAVVTAQPLVAGESTVHLDPESFLLADPNSAGPRVHGSEMAYVQFSSGSTGAPKALWLEMGAIAFNLEGMHRWVPIIATDHVFSWLPVYHDMGLFGAFLLALYAGCPITMADPSLFARSPLMWFRVMQEKGCNATVGPPSAVSGALQLLKRRPLEGLDLSHCERWLIGAEQVTPTLIRKFNSVMKEYGVPPEALKPVYGMAEVTLGATIPRIRRKQRTEGVQRQAFEMDSVALLASADALPQDILEWTGCGVPLEGQGMRIADKDGNDLPERHVGSILLKSASLFSGYLDGDGIVPREGEWYDTGDLGYVVDGEVFITGRNREVIIKNGRNYAPERIEELAGSVDGVGRGAAFGIFDSRRQTERIVLYVEVQPKYLRAAEQRDLKRLEIRNALASAHFEIDEVQIFAKGFLPRTTSGKIRRGTIHQQYLQQLSKED
jgi:acyl-CoA synthetase (AMP-forming)/AMP-acid ligase II